MPWLIKKVEGKWCVYKETSSGSGVTTGGSLGCHDSHSDAVDQLQALYVNVPDSRKKELAARWKDAEKSLLEGLLLPFGGPNGGKDLEGEYFSDQTDFALDWYDTRPLLYAHGRDDDGPGASPVGVIKSIEVRDDGGWMEAQLDKSHKYWTYITKLVDDGKLFLSSGSLSHLVRKDYSTGELLRWPVVEGTLTPIPANPIAVVGFKEVGEHFEHAGLKDLWPGPVYEGPAGGDEEDEPTLPMAARKELVIPALEGTYEQRIEELNEGVRRLFANKSPGGPVEYYGAYVVGTFPDRVVVRTFQGGGQQSRAKFYEVDYRETDLGYEFDEPVEVTFEVAEKSLTYLDQSEGARDALLGWYHRTKDAWLLWTGKEGRKLTTARRKRLEEWREMLQSMSEDVAGMLSEVEPPEKSEAVTRKEAVAAFLAQYVTTAELTADAVGAKS